MLSISFVFVLNLVTVLFLSTSVLASPDASDTMSSLTAGANSSHLISFTFITPPVENDMFAIKLQDLTQTPAGFDCTGLVDGDVTTSTGWTVFMTDHDMCWVALDAGATPSNPVVLTIASAHMKNPVTAGGYTIAMGNVTGDPTLIQVGIVDSDTVNVNGYINTRLTFDLDTGTDYATAQCNASGTLPDACAIYAGGEAGTNYTVDLGNLTMGVLNESGLSRLHSTGDTETINYIFFDISTNAASGAIITMKSIGTNPGHLDGPGSDAQDIPSVNDGDYLIDMIETVTAGYGYSWDDVDGGGGYNTGINWTALGGGETDVWSNGNCDDYDGAYCAIPTTATPIFESYSSIEDGRGAIKIGATVDVNNIPGTYRDTLQLVATSTF